MNKDRKLKLLLITPYFYPESGGLESYAYNISKGLVEKGFDVTILCSTRDKNDKTEFIDGIKVIRQKPNFILSNTPIRFNLFFTMSKFIKENNFDLINAHTPVPFYADIAAMVSKIHKIPFVLAYHNDNVKNTFAMNIIANIYNYSFNLATLKLSKIIITPSPYCYNQSKFLKKFEDKLRWIPPGVDINKYDIGNSFKIYDDYDIPRSSKIVLFVGQISKAHAHKGIDDLIKSFKKVLKDVKDVYLVLVGKGDMIPEYKKMCDALGISDNVIFTGFVDDDILIEYYKSSHVIVLPSTTVQEGFGMVLIEGNACEKPVIGTKVGGIQYVIKDGENGLLIPPKNLGALADAIIKLLNNEDLAKKMGKDGRRLVEEKYTWKRATEMTEKVYGEVTEGRR